MDDASGQTAAWSAHSPARARDALTRQQTHRRARLRTLRRHAVSYAFLLPAIGLFVAFKYYPMLLALKLSFAKLTLQGDEWVGLANFQRFILDEDAHHALL